jgi:hypothetical protein
MCTHQTTHVEAIILCVRRNLYSYSFTLGLSWQYLKTWRPVIAFRVVSRSLSLRACTRGSLLSRMEHPEQRQATSCIGQGGTRRSKPISTQRQRRQHPKMTVQQHSDCAPPTLQRHLVHLQVSQRSQASQPDDPTLWRSCAGGPVRLFSVRHVKRTSVFRCAHSSASASGAAADEQASSLTLCERPNSHCKLLA